MPENCTQGQSYHVHCMAYFFLILFLAVVGASSRSYVENVVNHASSAFNGNGNRETWANLTWASRREAGQNAIKLNVGGNSSNLHYKIGKSIEYFTTRLGV
ncbi:hypothetical protein BCR44DRAFT_1431849 [Catenaria anguillulae PL171]|uniref:Uncharacterized protein n=1 Tax=Catenaria anguillulae PL171 TaxID=765915 RepID=A0A1Y2HSZ0_9FUNG|nr:hypothetical protein BCR44DRAFT_1431849 [Catenaria anguillulae PL171]